MKKQSYEMHQLNETFLRHHEKFMKDNQEFKEKYADAEIYKVEGNDFSIALALHYICKEIIEIKKFLLAKNYKN